MMPLSRIFREAIIPEVAAAVNSAESGSCAFIEVPLPPELKMPR